MLLIHVCAHVTVDADNLGNDLDPLFQREFHRCMRVCAQLAFSNASTGSNSGAITGTFTAQSPSGHKLLSPLPGQHGVTALPGSGVLRSTTPTGVPTSPRDTVSTGRVRFLQARSASTTAIGESSTAGTTHSRLLATASVRRLRVTMPGSSGGSHGMTSPTLGVNTSGLGDDGGLRSPLLGLAQQQLPHQQQHPHHHTVDFDADEDEDVESAFVRVSVRDVADKWEAGSLVDRLTHFRAFGKRKDLQVRGCLRWPVVRPWVSLLSS
jgi:hypothetical protein